MTMKMWSQSGADTKVVSELSKSSSCLLTLWLWSTAFYYFQQPIVVPLELSLRFIHNSCTIPTIPIVLKVLIYGVVPTSNLFCVVFSFPNTQNCQKASFRGQLAKTAVQQTQSWGVHNLSVSNNNARCFTHSSSLPTNRVCARIGMLSLLPLSSVYTTPLLH
jgi:hypothetical protein